jgi:polar amino acid transport system substrate-binding protein
LAPELVKAAFAAEGVDVEFRTIPFARCMYEALRSDKVLGCFDATITEENRYQYFWHETPMFEEDLAIFALAREPRRDLKLTSLEQKTVGITPWLHLPHRLHGKPQDHPLPGQVRRPDHRDAGARPGRLHPDERDAGLPQDPAKTAEREGGQGGQDLHRRFLARFSRAHPQGEAMAKRFEEGLQKIRNNGTTRHWCAPSRPDSACIEPRLISASFDAHGRISTQAGSRRIAPLWQAVRITPG